MNKKEKTILITGATDGIGLAAAKIFTAEGHHLLLHGRNSKKLEKVCELLAEIPGAGSIESYVADFSDPAAVEAMAKEVTSQHSHLDVLINNAGILKTSDTITSNNLDVRFAVNTIAPFLLTQRLMPLIGRNGRVINLSSRAQSPVQLAALKGQIRLSDHLDAYAQSKLAITMWTLHMAAKYEDLGIIFVAVNPGSLLASKMVKESFGVEGNDLSVGADILYRAALSEEFSAANGRYYDNDAGKFSAPHPHALDPEKVAEVVAEIENLLADS